MTPILINDNVRNPRNPRPEFLTGWQGYPVTTCAKSINPNTEDRVHESRHEGCITTAQAIQPTDTAIHELSARAALAARTQRVARVGLATFDRSALDLRAHSVLRAAMPVLRMQCGD